MLITRLFPFLALASLLPHCSAAKSTPAAAQIPVFSTQSIYAAYAATPAAVRSEQAAALGKLSFEQYYQLVHGAPAAASLELNGVRLDNVGDKLTAAYANLQQLGLTYPNLQAYWDANQISPAALTEAQLDQQSLQIIGKAPAELGLNMVDDHPCLYTAFFNSHTGPGFVSLVKDYLAGNDRNRAALNQAYAACFKSSKAPAPHLDFAIAGSVNDCDQACGEHQLQDPNSGLYATSGKFTGASVPLSGGHVQCKCLMSW